MRHALIFLMVSAFTAGVAAIACDSSDSPATDVAADGGDEASDTTVTPPPPPPTSSTPSGPAGTGLATGLPCDVQGILENRCIACHNGATQAALLNYEDLAASSKNYPGKTMAQAALEEMKAKTMPPSPAAPPEDDEIASFEEWLAAGAPKNPMACTDPPPTTDGGTPPPSDAGVTCTSGKFSTVDGGSELMRPGEACNACHQQQGGPNLRIAGTVYPSLHEPNGCIGSTPPPPLHVIVTDSRNATFDMEVNDAGNFLTKTGARPRPPLKAMVTDGTKTRAMAGTVTSGDCNSCHTANGLNGAPGRIMAP